MKELLFFSLMLIITGCDVGSSSSASVPTATPAAPAEPEMPPGHEKMEAGKVYVVNHGDYLVKTTDDAQVKVVHKGGETVSTIELVLGEANIIRKQ